LDEAFIKPATAPPDRPPISTAEDHAAPKYKSIVPAATAISNAPALGSGDRTPSDISAGQQQTRAAQVQRLRRASKRRVR
jgi:hypothetical protein